MFDIDYILGNKKSKKSSKDPLRDLFGIKPSARAKPKNNIVKSDFMSLFLGQGNPRPDRKTPKQKAFHKKTRTGSGNSHKRFWDLDGDGVIAGLDCAPRNSKKHRANKMIRDKLRTWDVRESSALRRRTSDGFEPVKDKVDINSPKGKILQNTVKKYPELLSMGTKVFGKEDERETSMVNHFPRKKWKLKFDNSIDADGELDYYDSSVKVKNWDNDKIDQDMKPNERANVLFHELRHEKQFRDDDDFAFNYGENRLKYGYLDQPEEVDARVSANEKIYRTKFGGLSDEQYKKLAESRDKSGSRIFNKYYEDAIKERNEEIYSNSEIFDDDESEDEEAMSKAVERRRRAEAVIDREAEEKSATRVQDNISAGMTRQFGNDEK